MKRLAKYLLAFLFYFFSLFSFAQQNLLTGKAGKIDSLLSLLKNAKDDTATVSTLLKLSKHFLNKSNFDSCLRYADKGFALAEKISFREGIADALLLRGNAYHRIKIDILSARKDFFQAKEFAEKIDYKKALCKILSGIAWTYQDEGNNAVALAYFLKALKVAETTGIKKLIASAHHGLGVNYAYRGDYHTALKEYFDALKINEELKDTMAILTSYFVIGIAYSSSQIKNFPLAIEYQFKRIKLLEAIHDTVSVAYGYNELASITSQQQNTLLAMQYCFKALDILKHTNELEGIANTYGKIAAISIDANQYEKAFTYANEGLKIAKQIHSFPQISFFYNHLSMYYAHKNDYQNAYKYFQLYTQAKDSMMNKESSKQIAEMQTKYETEKKEQQITILNKEKEKQSAVAEEKNHKQQIVIWSVAGGLFLVIIFAGFVFRTLKNTRRQKEIIEEKQKEILDSIRYAKRIQQSLLTSEKYIEKSLKRLMENK